MLDGQIQKLYNKIKLELLMSQEDNCLKSYQINENTVFFGKLN